MAISQVEMNTGVTVAMGTPRFERARSVQVSAETVISAERARQVAAEMQRQIERMNVSLAFTTYGGGDKFAVVIADKVTGEVIREIPSRELQELYTKMDELSGMLFNRQV
jgi:uncharacterized FlaG/YvyC family protein